MLVYKERINSRPNSKSFFVDRFSYSAVKVVQTQRNKKIQNFAFNFG